MAGRGSILWLVILGVGTISAPCAGEISFQGLGDLEGGTFFSIANAASEDGSVVVGQGDPESGNEAFRWEDGIMTGLGDLEGGTFNSRATDVSSDGSVVIGQGESDYGDEAFIWDAENGMRSLQDVLETVFQLDLTGWSLRAAHGISTDGLTIVGQGINPDGYTEAWIATVPEPATVILFALGGRVLRRRR